MRVQIHVTFEDTSRISLQAGTYPEVVNVSRAENTFSEPSTGSKGFQLSPSRDIKVSTLNGTFGLYSSNGYSGILTRQISDENGVFEEPVVITFSTFGFGPDVVYILFDQTCNEYATELMLYVNGTGSYIVNNSVYMRLDLSEYALLPGLLGYNVELRILKWSRPLASAKISYISSTYAEIFTGNTIDNLICSENALDSQAIIQPGIVEQYADISLYDRFGRLHDAADNNNLLNNITLQIYAVEDNDDRKILGDYVATTWDINADNKIVNLSAADPSINFDKIYIKDIPVMDRSIHEMLVLLFGYVEDYQWKYIDTATQRYCETIITPNNWFAEGHLYEQLQKVCAAGMLRIYWFNKMFIVMRCW